MISTRCAWGKENIRVPDRNQTHDLLSTGWVLCLLRATCTKTHGEEGHLTEFICDTHLALHRTQNLSISS